MLSASLFGYYAFSEEISISAGQENIMDIVMQPLPGITVSGQLVANYDESVGIAGAAVRLEGYADFSTVSDAGGFFSLEGVYGDQEYVLWAEAEGYEPFFQTFLVPSEDTDLGALSLQESPLPPGNILAEETDNGEVQVSWTFPGEGYPEYEIAFDHNFPTNAMNWDELGGE